MGIVEMETTIPGLVEFRESFFTEKSTQAHEVCSISQRSSRTIVLGI